MLTHPSPLLLSSVSPLTPQAVVKGVKGSFQKYHCGFGLFSHNANSEQGAFIPINSTGHYGGYWLQVRLLSEYWAYPRDVLTHHHSVGTSHGEAGLMSY